MARQRSDERRSTIMTAAARVIATQGLPGATTSAIAQEAGVSNGSLFVYFNTKAALLNELYTALKTEMGEAASASLPPSVPVRQQVRLMWDQWLAWATSNPTKRRALAQLEVAEDVSPEAHRAVREAQSAMADLIDRARLGGPMDGVPIAFVLAMVSSIADTTMDALIKEPDAAVERSDVAFDAVWRVLAG